MTGNNQGNTPPAETGRLLTSAEVGDLFRVGRGTVTRWAATGQIAAIRTPTGRWRYPETAVRALLALNRQPS